MYTVATLAAGLDGIASCTELPPRFEGAVYTAQDLPQVPAALNEATDAMAQSTWMRQTFGEEVIEHDVCLFQTEQRKFDAVVTNWERARYFERA